MLFPINSKISFVAHGKLHEFILTMDSDIDTIEDNIIEAYGNYREESLCINGVNYMYPLIKSGYMVIEGHIGDLMVKHRKETWFSLKNTQEILKYGLRKGDRLELIGVSDLKVTEVDYGNQMLCVSFE